MPILNELGHDSDWMDPDEVPRPVVTYGFITEVFGSIELAPHRHAKGQIILAQRGALSCEVDGGLWIVPPRSAIWIPGGALHSVKATGALEGYNAFIAPDAEAGLPGSCCALSVSPLLRELLARAAAPPALYEGSGAHARVVSGLPDEIAAPPAEGPHLPMPPDALLHPVVDPLMAAPAERGTLDAWARRAGLSERTLARLIHRETGMSFGRWRQQLGVMLAIKWLAGGASIQQVAADLGYESVPSFVTLFRKALGTSPGRYMAERHASRR